MYQLGTSYENFTYNFTCETFISQVNRETVNFTCKIGIKISIPN